MKLCIGIVVAPRPEPTYKAVVDSMSGFQHAPILFCEPGCKINNTEYLCVERPNVEAESTFQHSEDGVFGNFQNWIQAARDMLEISHDSDTFMICEDDALFARDIASLLERDLWPSEKCGCISLYCPEMSQYQRGTGLFMAKIVKPKTAWTSSMNNLVGSLALVFPRHILEELVSDEKSIKQWKGSHQQAREKFTKPWERKAVDTWIGRRLVAMNKEVWHYSPSLILHYSPLPEGESNSSLGHPAPRGRGSVRQCREWIGSSPDRVDLLKTYPEPKVRYDLNPN